MDPVMHFLTQTVHDALQLPGGSRAVWAAHRIDDYYCGGYQLSGRDSSFFLAHLYYLIFSVVKFIPHGGPLQGVLVDLVTELRKLPERGARSVAFEIPSPYMLSRDPESNRKG